MLSLLPASNHSCSFNSWWVLVCCVGWMNIVYLQLSLINLAVLFTQKIGFKSKSRCGTFIYEGQFQSMKQFKKKNENKKKKYFSLCSFLANTCWYKNLHQLQSELQTTVEALLKQLWNVLLLYLLFCWLCFSWTSDPCLSSNGAVIKMVVLAF